MRTIRLWNISGAAIIVPEPSRVIYQNQVNGTACFQKEIEGILIPINNDYDFGDYESSLEYRLMKFFSDLSGEFGAKHTDELNKLLKDFPETSCIEVDMDLISDSYEAWVHVTVNESKQSYFEGFGTFKGVLTWLNSD